MKEQKAKFYMYLKTKKVGWDILKAKDKDTNKEVILSITKDGELYDKKGSKLNKSQQTRYWEALFNFAKEKKHLILDDTSYKDIFGIQTEGQNMKCKTIFQPKTKRISS